MSRALRFALVLAGAVCTAASPALAQLPAGPPAVASLPPAQTAPTAVIQEEGLVAEYYAADPAVVARGAVVVLGGSEGGLAGSRGLARALAKTGLDALAVSYFGEPGQSSRLDQVPIEPVGRAVDWLQARADGAEPVAVIGVSKGAELALIVASRDDRIRAVAVGVPSNVAWQGIDMAGGPTGSSWTAAGRALPYVPYDLLNGFRGIHQLYVDSLAGAAPASEIPVEDIEGPILMISGGADALWPSADMSRRIEDRLKARGFTPAVTNLIYPDAGHAAFGPPLSNPEALRAQLGFLGGTVEGTASARIDGWPRVVGFLKTALAD